METEARYFEPSRQFVAAPRGIRRFGQTQCQPPPPKGSVLRTGACLSAAAPPESIQQLHLQAENDSFATFVCASWPIAIKGEPIRIFERLPGRITRFCSLCTQYE